jgi:ADP-heptose:LPS heptosyltransferase
MPARWNGVRILLIQLKRLGDVILTAPAVSALRETFPDAELVMACAASAASLARMMPGLSRVIEYRSGKVNLRLWASAIAGSWDACLDFTGTDRAALLMRASRAKRRIAFAKFATNRLRRGAATELCDASVRELHTVDFHRALVRKLEPAYRDGNFKRHLRIPDRKVAQMPEGRFAVVHPGTAREEKFWPDERWAEVIDALQRDFSLPVLLTGSGDGLEKPHLNRIKKLLHVPVTDLAGALSLEELAVVIARSEIALGVDSMAMHLAAMFEKPQVAIFGPTNPFHWRPRHDRAVVLQGASDAPMTEFFPKSVKHEMKNVSTRAVVNAIGMALRTHGRTEGEK